MSEKMLGMEKKKFWKLYAWVMGTVVFLLIIVMIIVATSPDETELAMQEANPIEAIVIESLGLDTDNEKPVYISHEYDGELLRINLNVTHPQYSNELIQSQMHEDTTAILPSLFEKEDANEIEINWYLTMVDVRGNRSEDEVMKITFTRENVETIQWDGFSYLNIPLVANNIWVHPALQK